MLPGSTRPALLQLLAYLRDPYLFFDELRAEHGDLFTIRLPGLGEQVVVASPEALKQIGAGSYDDLEREAGFLRFLLGERALIFQEGSRHRKLRTLMSPAFHGDRMRGYGRAMEEVTTKVLAARGSHSASPIQADMHEITLRVILHCVFGLSEGTRFDRMRSLMLAYMESIFHPAIALATALTSGERVLAGIEWLGAKQRAAYTLGSRANSPASTLGSRADSPASTERAPSISRWPVKRAADCLGAIDAILFEEIEQCRKQGVGRDDVLSMLVNMRDEQGLPLSREELRDQLLLLLIGGHETTANSLCWAIHQLSGHPDVVEEVRREQAAKFPNGFDPSRARELPYLGAVIQESMRLQPIAVGVARRLKRDLSVDGHTLKAGTLLLPASYLAQRDARRWERPLAFEPQRFLGKKIDMTVHFPFGLGVWRCLGAAFADYEMRVVLSLLISRYDIVLARGEKAQPVLKGVTISPKSGLRVRLVPRAQK